MPVITHNITIYDDLRFKLHCQGTDVSVKTVSDICCVPGAFSSVSEVLTVIARLKSVTVTVAARLSAAATLLDTIAESSDGDVCPVVWRTLVKEQSSRQRLFGSNLPRAVFVNVVSEVITSAENVTVSDISCEGGHCLATVVSRMAGSLFNLFASNMVRDANSRLHGKWKRSTDPGASTSKERCSREDQKRRKLSGSKKT
ncbi:uncharacterized protein LOC122374213 [Amphibalanus amphitrite]|uniref:uncharacterized protein LOC122374213 n=1 Tax=Amphibalanus amphitrite TaxID=1232801 RepID=UPI001C8FB016|nr:uncharacterized protein LOC122374213 [Amphibalanus amphitrite]